VSQFEIAGSGGKRHSGEARTIQEGDSAILGWLDWLYNCCVVKPFIAVVLFSLAVFVQNDHHHTGAVQRGESHAGMGFSQATTTHHFILAPIGGIIQVTTHDATDSGQIDTIQTHLKHIAQMFSEGNFSIPRFVHDQTPRGVGTTKNLGATIHYAAEMLKDGARVRIDPASPEGIAAVHDFLRFQIKDHETGDPLTVQNSN
jgi:hypothetical protein